MAANALNVTIPSAAATIYLRKGPGFLRGSYVTTTGTGTITYYDALTTNVYVNAEAVTITSHSYQVVHHANGISSTSGPNGTSGIVLILNNVRYSIVPAGLEVAGQSASVNFSTGTFTLNASDPATSGTVSYWYDSGVPQGPAIASVPASPTVNTQVAHNAAFQAGCIAVATASCPAVTAQIEF